MMSKWYFKSYVVREKEFLLETTLHRIYFISRMAHNYQKMLLSRDFLPVNEYVDNKGDVVWVCLQEVVESHDLSAIAPELFGIGIL